MTSSKPSLMQLRQVVKNQLGRRNQSEGRKRPKNLRKSQKGVTHQGQYLAGTTSLNPIKRQQVFGSVYGNAMEKKGRDIYMK